MAKVIKAEEVAALIKDGSTFYTCGFGLACFAEEVAIALEKSFLETGHPRDLTIYYSAGTGNFKDKGLNHFAHEGMLKRIIGGHFGACGVDFARLVAENKIEAYNWPQGVLAVLPRNIAGRRGGLLTKVGLETFVDPRIEGSKANEKAKEDLIEYVQFAGEEWLYYKAPKVDVALIRGTVADENGNLTQTNEGILTETLSVAQAAKACGGIVIAQVKHIVKAGSLHPKQIKVPGISIDYIVVAQPENHYQTMGTRYNPVFAGDLKIPISSLKPLELDERKLVCRRAAMELSPNVVVNLGIGMPDGVSAIAAEEKVDHLMHLTTESGGIGGVPAPGLDFGHAINADAIIEHQFQFDFYDGGGIDITFLGLAQTDSSGNVNVSKFSGRAVGCGGFINITQNAKKVVFCGTFTAGGLVTEIADGKLKIVKEGKSKKFVTAVEQITFSGKYATKIGQPVLYVTERAVFKLTPEGLELIEIAPGVDLEKDILQQMEFMPIIRNVKLMDPAIFQEKLGELESIIQKSSK